MERYFYHGVGSDISTDTLDLMLNILEMGILKSRNSVGYSGDEYEHVCLYRKNDKHNYHEKSGVGTAYDGWIDNAFCFIIYPEIMAEKAKCYYDLSYEISGEFTDLVDEWRSEGDISIDKVVGIGIPMDDIKESRELNDGSINDDFDNKLERILEFAEEMDWMIINSNDPNFADELDIKLNSSSNNKYL